MVLFFFALSNSALRRLGWENNLNKQMVLELYPDRGTRRLRRRRLCLDMVKILTLPFSFHLLQIMQINYVHRTFLLRINLLPESFK